jgi:hypothetical protein
MAETAEHITAFPAALPVKSLREVHPEYDGEKIKNVQCLYEAGTKFRESKAKFLTRREFEKTSCGEKHYASRLEIAAYIPRGPGLVDYVVAKMFERNPRITVTGGSAASKKYWEGLNENCDGLGTNFAALCRKAAREILLHGRGHLGLDFPYTTGHATQPDTLNANWKVIGAQLADDWEYSEDGKLNWLRTHTASLDRLAPWLQPDTEIDCWRYYTPTEIVEYEHRKPRGTQDKSDAVAGRNAQPHGFKVPPIFPIRASAEMWVMERVYDILVALFNREVSITWALDRLAYCLLVLNLENPDNISKVVAADTAALKLNISEKASIISPDAAIVEPLLKDGERLKQSLYEVIQSLSINAAAVQTQNARQSAQAKQLDRDPLQTLLASYTWPIKDTLMQAIEALKQHRREPDLQVEVEGMDVFTATLEDLRAQIDKDDPNTPTPEVKPAAKAAKSKEQ